METISRISLWLSKIGIFCAIITIIGSLISEWIGIDAEFTMLVFGISTLFTGGIGFTLGLIGNLKKHKQQENAQKGFKYGIYSLLILIASFVVLVIIYFSKVGALG